MALRDNLPLDDLLAGKTIEDIMNLERHEAYDVSSPPKEAAPLCDHARNNNCRIPSSDEPSQKRRHANTTASTTNKTTVQLLADNHELRTAYTGSQLPMAS
jgi:hypothetical protein